MTIHKVASSFAGNRLLMNIYQTKYTGAYNDIGY